jgi:hypothetical protein
MNLLARSLGLVLLGVFATLLGQRLFLGESPAKERTALLQELATRQNEQMARLTSVAEERARMTQELTLHRFYRLQEFRQFGTEGLALAWLVPVETGSVVDPLEGAGGSAVRIPRLAIDASARTTWTQAVQHLSALEDNVDVRIFAAFESVLEFTNIHPWPDGSGLEAGRRAGWTSPDVIEGWLSLNRALVSRVDGLLSGF